MTPESQRIALAKWAGWTDIANEEFFGAIILKGTCPHLKCTQAVPDFLHDLNAVHELEERLSESDQFKYYWRLLDVVLAKIPVRQLALVSATAVQRCEALLRCLGLWED